MLTVQIITDIIIESFDKSESKDLYDYSNESCEILNYINANGVNNLYNVICAILVKWNNDINNSLYIVENITNKIIEQYHNTYED